MTGQLIPAQKGFYLLLHKGTRRVPVVAWETCEDGTLWPVTPEPFSRRVIQYPNGKVFDQDRQIAFDDEIDWYASEVRP